MEPEVFAVPELDRSETLLPASRGGKRYVCFGPFHVDLHQREVFKQGVRLKIQGKAYEVLWTLLERSGEVVTREELRQRLWPSDIHVNFEANLNTTVNKLRHILDDSSGQSRYVQTLLRRGYCFVAPAEYVDTPPATAPRTPKASRRASAKPTQGSASPQRTRYPAIWTVVAAIAILTGGMLFGAGIVTLWFAHAFALPWH